MSPSVNASSPIFFKKLATYRLRSWLVVVYFFVVLIVFQITVSCSWKVLEFLWLENLDLLLICLAVYILTPLSFVTIQRWLLLLCFLFSKIFRSLIFLFFIGCYWFVFLWCCCCCLYWIFFLTFSCCFNLSLHFSFFLNLGLEFQQFVLLLFRRCFSFFIVIWSGRGFSG